ncbi:BatA and WFA domain-containing protein [Planctomicrobium sp.]|nr:BatA and WFA domain-containing protein [Planctomicrobium sp.]MBT5019946.1 VWA domain-containing protein [Planctomicrobium sp.]MDB4733012.1 BatA and WFA domain-containing protein [Planctomicrobium sp.]
MFTNPWAILIGVAAAGLPVFIHWLTRPRPVRLPVSTLRFIRGAVQQRRARYRLRDLLVLLLRTAAILLLAFAISRPLFNKKVVAAADEEPSSTIRTILLDCSQSMAARDGGIAHFERARPFALDAVKFQSSLKANLLLMAANPLPVFDTPTSNLGALREALQQASVRPEVLKVQSALNTAGEMLSKAAAGTKLEVIILSDFQRTNWSTADFSVFPKDCDIQLKGITQAEEIPNIAVLDVSAAGRVQVGQESEFTVQVVNHSNADQHVRAELSLGNVVVPFEGHLPPRAKTTMAGSVPTPEAGWQIGEIQLTGNNDSLSIDDTRAVAIEVHEHPRIVFLTRERKNQIASSAYFLDRAVFATGVIGYSKKEPLLWLDAADPNIDDLRSADIVLIVRSGRMTPQTTAVLAAMIQRGTNILYVAADALDAANLKDLAQGLGSSVRLPVEFAPLPTQRNAGQRFLTDVDRRQSPFSVFGDQLAGAVKSLTFEGGLITRPLTDGLKEDIRGTLSDQSAFLTVSSTGRGKLAVLNVDLERSNLAKTPILVPLLGELIQQELTHGKAIKQNYFSGEPFTLSLPIGEERIEDLEIIASTKEVPIESEGRFVSTPLGVTWEVPRAGPPGIYQVMLDGEILTAIATSIPHSESDLRLLPPRVFNDRLSGGREINFEEATSLSTVEQDTLWVWLATGCVICMMFELFVLKLFRN